MTDENQEQNEEQPEIIRINPRDQVRALIQAKELAEETTSYSKKDNGFTMIFYDNGTRQIFDRTLEEYLRRAEKRIIEKRMDEIIKQAHAMIEDELNQVKELLK